ncbi:efflux RND transporter periplasmic adaptor subunit [Methylovirgula sp. HY1]|uniref:efflux RND transporter periplasmic adaptor subunit n=1 Tax=Methylovirgula sp. HY1 TaxID=2822761 RepID=UPI001C5B5413|nr:efflux RND transporter periplasmic adaptor subunit [Methylovirgula sp. HY1]QXX73869.1 Multidrug resistance protein MdtA [Methylovirgula sp. HY1]
MSSSAPKTLGRKVVLILALVGLVAGVVAFRGVTSREKSEAGLAKWTRARAIQTVTVVHPAHIVGFQQLILPGQVDAWYSARIHAQVSGYVKMWYKDIGAKVKAGDVLAEIDAPELDQQLEQSKGELAKALANAALAEVTAKRWEALQKSNAVSQQVTDEKESDYKAQLAQVAAAKANVARLEAFENFKKLVAPFNGVVTARKIDVGALVHDGTKSASTELFKVSDVHEMRIYVDVPQAYAAQIHRGMTAELKLAQYPGKTFHAVVATTSDAIATKSRTLQVELHRMNQDGRLQPGAFVEVHFKLPANSRELTLPASALIFRRDNLRVALVGPDNKIKLKTIQLGRDLGTVVEVRSGLSPEDRVVKNPSDSIADGDIVKIAGQDGDAAKISAR